MGNPMYENKIFVRVLFIINLFGLQLGIILFFLIISSQVVACSDKIPKPGNGVVINTKH